MTEEIAATPGWVEQRLDDIFATLPPGTAAAQAAYADCLARRKEPGAPSDLLGSEFDGCRTALRRAMPDVDDAVLAALDQRLSALEAEIDEGS